MNISKENIIDAFISILIAETVGFISGILAGNSREIYKTLNLPTLSPPAWLFPVVWVILYALMGIAAYMIFATKPSASRKTALYLYTAQLCINFIWSIVFFRFSAFGAAIFVIVILDALVAMTIIAFKKISAKAAYIMIPYLLWILFATYLNVGIYLLN